MKHIFGNLKNYWVSVVAILALLLLQAKCDLSLPDYTSKIIDVGIANSGVEYGVPEIISKESFAQIGLFLSDEELQVFEGSYEYDDENDYYSLIDDSRENREKLDSDFGKVIATVYMLSAGYQGETGGSADMSQMTPESLEKLEQLGITKEMLMSADFTNPATIKMLMMAMRKGVEEQLDTLGDSIVNNMAKNFAKAEYEKCGIDLQKMQSAYMWAAGAKMMGMALIMALAAIAIGFLASRVAANVGRDLRGRVFKKVIGFSDAELDKFSTASLITRSTNDVQQIQMVTVILLRMVLYAPILAIGGIINIQNYKSGMSWIIVLAIALVVCLIAILMVVAMPKFKIMQDLVDRVNLVAREILTGLPVIRAFGREKTEEERFDKANSDLTNVMLFVNRAMATMMPALMIIMNGISVLIVWTAAQKIDAGELQVGAMTAFITYAMLIIMGFLMLTMVSIMLPRAGVAADRIWDVLTTEEVIFEKENAVTENPSDATVIFNHVDFKYPDGEENVLEDIDFVAKPGQTTAIIGSTGCGKSTLVKLLPRFFDVTGGSITIGGVDIRDYSLKALRGQMGYVPQKGILFSGDINSNIAYGAKDATKEDIEEAARIAQAEEFINEKPDKYESTISQGGTNVSGGQKQRLSIARAIARNPKIYIFDDSFSALDFKTDTLLRKALESKTKNATVFIVAQRVNTILNADQIIVLEDGKMIGKGTHRELVENCETYLQIAKSQLSEAEFLKSIGKGEM